MATNTELIQFPLYLELKVNEILKDNRQNR